MNVKLENKTIVITGGTKGIGRALVHECLNNGANVVFGGRDIFAANQILKECEHNKEKILFVETNLQNVKDCKVLFECGIKKFGNINGFVNYAGVTPISSVIDCDEETYDQIMDINIKSAFFCVKYAIKSMIDVGGGSIILVGSTHSWSGQKDRAAYAISKGALYTLSEHLSHNYAIDNIRCNFITMGWTPTEGEFALRSKQGMSKDELMNYASSILPMGRMLTAEDHLPAFVYLLSDDSLMVTGANIRVTAGEYI
jgi:NAD(P)-dependent dehydrogenase (short-subunit alcohol dehydrogenase family)